mmetsp:Transcript_35125/g.76890  ORF Transcript_35125/g.76890 Transcript_35125/m.76890 type:complete len:556 (+) Transcript_35125:218-1885(+)
MSAPNSNQPYRQNQQQQQNGGHYSSYPTPRPNQLQSHGYAGQADATGTNNQQPQYQYHQQQPQYQYQQSHGGLYGAPPPGVPSHVQYSQHLFSSSVNSNVNQQQWQHQQYQQQQQQQYQYTRAIPAAASYIHGYGAPLIQQQQPLGSTPPPPPPNRTNQEVAAELRKTLGSKRNNNKPRTRSRDDNVVNVPLDKQVAEKGGIYKCPNCPSASFPTQRALDTHISAHVTCRHEGCGYTASKGLVNAHFASKHGKFKGRGLKTITIAVPGCRVQKFKICVGSHPDDIQAWIEERKKKFPTRAKLKKKSEVEARRRAEGALLNGSVASKPGEKRRSDAILTGDDASAVKKPRLEENKEAENVGDSTNNGGPNGALSSLLGGYGSSSSDEDDCKETDGISNPKDDGTIIQSDAGGEGAMADTSNTSQNPFYRTRPCRFYLRTGHCRNGDNCNYIHEDGEARRSAEGQRLDQSRRDKARSDARKEVERLNGPRAKRGRDDELYVDPGAKAPLLRKLLQNDIRRERSLTLQLLRYVVDCNYLQEKKVATNIDGEEQSTSYS